MILMVEAVVLINAETELPQNQVLEKLKKIIGVDEAYSSFGVYNFVAKVQAESIDELKALVFQRIRRTYSIQSTLTLLVTGEKGNW